MKKTIITEKKKKYTYVCAGFYTNSSYGIVRTKWSIKTPFGRRIAETYGEGSAKKIVKGLNLLLEEEEK